MKRRHKAAAVLLFLTGLLIGGPPVYYIPCALAAVLCVL